MVNPMGTKGAMAQAFAAIVRDMWQGEMPTLNPMPFRVRFIYHCYGAHALI